MKGIISALIIATALFSATACNNNSTGDKPADANTAKAITGIGQATWLVGAWKSAQPEGIAYEIWSKENDTCLAGKSFLVRGPDTIPMETMKLKQTGKDLLYIPTVNGQNGGQPVSFTLTSGASEEMVFENPTHDFPQKITYKHVTPDSLFAAISGKMGGQIHTESFPMERVK